MRMENSLSFKLLFAFITKGFAYPALLISSLTLSGCGMSGWSESSDETIRKFFTPRGMRMQMYSNLPTPYNQQRLDDQGNPIQAETLLRKMRNGNMPLQDRIRMKENRRFSKTPMEQDSYGLGFYHGCDTFTSVVAPGPQRMINDKIDADMMVNDPWYLRGFQDASTFCTHRLDWEMH